MAAVAVVIKVNLDKQAKNKSLTEGETAIETYLQSFDEEMKKEKSRDLYILSIRWEDYFRDRKILPEQRNEKADWYQNYSKANKKMYQYFVDYLMI